MVKNLMSIVLFALVFTGCGVHVSSDPVKVEGKVQHVVTIDTSQLAEFYITYCNDKLGPSATQEEMDQCVNDSLVSFWQAINSAVPKDQTVNQNP